jgi:lipopolysaccharide transport system permease protein
VLVVLQLRLHATKPHEIHGVYRGAKSQLDCLKTSIRSMSFFEIISHRSNTMDRAGVFWGSVTRAGISGIAELFEGALHWRVWHLLGVQQVRQRYVRSRLGQFWLLLSTALMIGAMSAVWSLLYNQNLRELMPSIGTGIIIWNYFSQVLIDCTTIFVDHGNFYRNQKMNFSVSIYAVMYKNTIMLVHNMIIVVALIIIFRVPINWYDLQLIPGLLLTWITMLWFGFLIAMLCVRYRDVIQLINNWLMVLFFISPVLWKRDFIPSEYRFLADYNPLAQFLELLRNPMLGMPVESYTWITTSVIAFGGAVLAVPIIGRYRRRVIFWT